MSLFVIYLLTVFSITVAKELLLTKNVPNEYFSISSLQFQPRALIVPSNTTKIVGAIQISSKYAFKSGTVIFTSNNTGSVGCSTAIVIQEFGDNFNGQYLLACDFASDHFNAYGDNFVSVILNDRQGNSVTFDYKDIQEFQLHTAYLTLSALEVLDAPETNPPVLKELSLSASKFYVNMATGEISPPTLTAVVRAQDTAGISLISIFIGKEGSVAPEACAGLVFYYSQNFVNGSFTDGVYEASCSMYIGASTISPIGNYTLFVVVSDLLGNSRDLDKAQLDSMGLPSTIEYVAYP